MQEITSVNTGLLLCPQRRAVILGASGGIGSALARELARRGVGLSLFGRSSQKLEILKRDIGEERRLVQGEPDGGVPLRDEPVQRKQAQHAVSSQSILVKQDDDSAWVKVVSEAFVPDDACMQRFVDTTLTAELQHADIFIHALGPFLQKPLASTTLDDWNDMIFYNLKFPAMCAGLAAALMAERWARQEQGTAPVSAAPLSASFAPAEPASAAPLSTSSASDSPAPASPLSASFASALLEVKHVDDLGQQEDLNSGTMPVPGGVIVLFGGTKTDSVRGYKTNAAYASAKTGLAVFAKSLAREYAGKGVSVIMVCPGFVETEYMTDERKQAWGKLSASGKLMGINQVASAICDMVCSPEVSLFSGSVITLDEGLVL